MSTYTQIIYQIVFGTKDGENTLTKDGRSKLFEYITAILLNNKCHVYAVNGVANHIHIVTHLHPTTALAWLVKEIKLASSAMIREQNIFYHFGGWQDGYGAFTYAINEKARLIDYVKNQEEHHKVVSFKDEYIELLKEHRITYDERYV